MGSSVRPEVRRLLRSPRTIVAEGVGVALAAVASTIVPQVASLAERGRFEQAHPVLGPFVRALGLDDVFRARWFLALVCLAGASLAIVLVEQWKRLAREWGRVPSEASFRTAPFRAEFERDARHATTRTWSSGRAGLLGSPLFHLGLMVVILAGVGRMLFGADAAVRLYEGEVLEARPGGLENGSAGLLASPVALESSILLRELAPERYASGGLQRFTATVALLGRGAREERVAINDPLELGSERLYLSSEHGCAAFVEIAWQGRVERQVVLLDESEPREFVRRLVLPGGLTLRLRAEAGRNGERPAALEVRALQDDALLAVSRVPAGEAVALPRGGQVRVHALRYWARFVATHDLSVWPAFIGFGLGLLGATLMLVLVKVDAAVIVRRSGAREWVTVALRPQRLAPLFEQRFERLVREEGGPTPG